MTTAALATRRAPVARLLVYAGSGLLALLLVAAFTAPNLLRSRYAADKAARIGRARQLVSAAAESRERSSDRQVIRSGVLQVTASRPAELAPQLARLADEFGGYVVSSTSSGEEKRQFANLLLRLPAARFDEARERIRRLAARVSSDTTASRDVTREYVDQQARLRNYRATESQYLEILRRAARIKDVIEVTDKLSEVRGAIETLEAQLRATEQEVAMAAIEVNIAALADTQVFGLEWRPLYQAKLALRSALEALGNFGSAAIYLLLHIPIVLLWLAMVIAVGRGAVAVLSVTVHAVPGVREWWPRQAQPSPPSA